MCENRDRIKETMDHNGKKRRRKATKYKEKKLEEASKGNITNERKFPYQL